MPVWTNALFGKHPGFRAAHAKGIVCEGEFTPSASAATLSKARHLQDKPVKVTARFSDSSGIPDIPDGAPGAGPRGLAVGFHLPVGGSTDIVANAFNGFPVATGEDFLAFLKAVAASGKDVPKPTPLDKFLASHPRAMEVAKAPKPVPASRATEVWPDNRPTVELGVVSITGKVADSDAAQCALGFDPLRLVDGI